MTKIDPPSRHVEGEELESFLKIWSESPSGNASVAAVVAALANAGIAIGALIAQGPLQGAMGAETGLANSDGDKQRKLDILAEAAVTSALKNSPTAYYASEEEDSMLTINDSGDV